MAIALNLFCQGAVGFSDWLGLLLCILSVSEVMIANVEQPDKHSSKKCELEQIADEFYWLKSEHAVDSARIH